MLTAIEERDPVEAPAVSVVAEESVVPGFKSPTSTLFRVWPGAYPAAVCDAVVAEFDDVSLYEAAVQTPLGEQKVEVAARAATHTFIEPEHWVGSLVSHFAHRANLVWNYDVVGLGTLSFIRYDEGGHFHWHVDTLTYDQSAYPDYAGQTLERKLSVTVNLSDPGNYEGGDIEFMNATGQRFARSETREQGSVVVFPSTVGHRVTPVSRGTRFVVVGWMVGPSLR